MERAAEDYQRTLLFGADLPPVYEIRCKTTYFDTHDA
jgi:hypothetical protein